MNPLLQKTDVASLTDTDVAWRIKTILKAYGVEALITGAHISAVFPDGAKALFRNLEIDTRK
jgi:hypothetical protein